MLCSGLKPHGVSAHVGFTHLLLSHDRLNVGGSTTTRCPAVFLTASVPLWLSDISPAAILEAPMVIISHALCRVEWTVPVKLLVPAACLTRSLSFVSDEDFMF